MALPPQYEAPRQEKTAKVREELQKFVNSEAGKQYFMTSFQSQWFAPGWCGPAIHPRFEVRDKQAMETFATSGLPATLEKQGLQVSAELTATLLTMLEDTDVHIDDEKTTERGVDVFLKPQCGHHDPEELAVDDDQEDGTPACTHPIHIALAKLQKALMTATHAPTATRVQHAAELLLAYRTQVPRLASYCLGDAKCYSADFQSHHDAIVKAINGEQ
eukprot:Clim_evm27s34 gene=Clim_evmTU27s34